MQVVEAPLARLEFYKRHYFARHGNKGSAKGGAARAERNPLGEAGPC